MDRRSQALILAELARLRPRDAVLGEEEGGRSGTSGVTWVVDPIDGTVNYLFGIPHYAVSVAAVVGDPSAPDGWWPVAGAVLEPVSGELFHAHLGGGRPPHRAARHPDAAGRWHQRPRAGPRGHRVRVRRGGPRAPGTGPGRGRHLGARHPAAGQRRARPVRRRLRAGRRLLRGRPQRLGPGRRPARRRRGRGGARRVGRRHPRRRPHLGRRTRGRRGLRRPGPAGHRRAT